MDGKRDLILIKDKNKTWQIERCCYDPQDQRYRVTFTHGKTYPYVRSSVRWLKDPEALSPILYHISKAGTPFYGIQSIFGFKDHDEWWHLIFENGIGKTYCKSELQIEKS